MDLISSLVNFEPAYVEIEINKEDFNLVKYRKVGKWMYYSVNEEKTHEISHLMEMIDKEIEKKHIKSECDCC